MASDDDFARDLITPQALRHPSSMAFLDPGGRADGAGSAPSFSTVYAFGDSLSDAGNVYIGTSGSEPVSPPYSGGRFTNGAVWVQDLATKLGLPQPQPSLAGGTDFAYGGAETGTEPLHTANVTDLPSQLAQFQAAVPSPQPNALYTVSIGSNDVADALSALSSNPVGAVEDIHAAVANEDQFISALAANGAKDFVVLNVPDLGVVPAFTSQGPLASAAASGLSWLYDVELAASLHALARSDALKIDLVNSYALVDRAVAHPREFGLTNVTDPVWTGNYTSASSGTLRATTPAAQNRYLFWDSEHPTAHGHEVVAQAAYRGLLHMA